MFLKSLDYRGIVTESSFNRAGTTKSFASWYFSLLQVSDTVSEEVELQLFGVRFEVGSDDILLNVILLKVT